MSKPNQTRPPKPPIRWTGILFALALNMLVVSAGMQIVRQWSLGNQVASIVLLLLAFGGGIGSALYVGQRAGIHVFLGGMLSIPALALITLNSDWRMAMLAGGYCALGGLLTERLRR